MLRETWTCQVNPGIHFYPQILKLIKYSSVFHKTNIQDVERRFGLSVYSSDSTFGTEVNQRLFRAKLG